MKFLFTLCGGHISPILVGAKKIGIRVVDVRNEANAVFAADAVARMRVYGDGSVGYSLTEFDSFTRHKIPVIAVVGNDASWMQIARDQVEILKDDVDTVLRRTDYHAAAEALGGKGLLLDDPSKTADVLAHAKELARAGHAVLVNAQLGRTEFRKNSISM